VSIKWVLVEEGRITDSFYAFTQGRPVQALARAMERLADSLASRLPRGPEPVEGPTPRLDAIGVTGSGRKLAGRLLGADLVVNEITAQATAMRVLDPRVDTIFEIGGQDAKYVRLEGERIADFALNTACSAGTGSLLLEESVRLGLDVSELDALADRSRSPLELHDRCTVFIDSDLVSRMQEGTTNEDLAAGMLRAVARNYLDRVVSHRSPGEHIVFAGGVSRSPTVRRELERILGRPVTASPWGALSGAIGAALMALGRSSSSHDASELRVPLSPRSVRTIRCHGCGGTCSVTRLDFEATERKPAVRLFSGDACGRWSERTDSGPDPESRRDVPPDDLFEERARLYGMDPGTGSLSPGQVGIPRAQQFWDLYPMLRTFLAELGLEAGLSSITTQATIKRGIALSRTEQCMPVKVALAHAAELVEKGCSALLVPSVGEYPQVENLSKPESDRLLPCIYTMQLGSVIQSTLGSMAREKDIPVLVPSLNLKPELESYTCRSLREALEPLGRFPLRRIRSAFRAARDYHLALRETSESLGLEALRSASPGNPAVVIFGRPYTIYDPVLNIQLVERLRRLGLTPIPFDTVLAAGKVLDHFSFMQWKMGADHLRAARAMVPFPDAHPLFLTYYGCGPDAFISKYFPELLGDRPSLSLELDGHSAEAGLETRLEAFADAIRSAHRRKRAPAPPPRLARSPSLMRGRTVALPRFADTVHAFAGALERVGMEAHIMPLADNETRLLGERFSDGRECNPHAIILGDLVRWARDPCLPSDKKGFFIPAARGPCLLTHYAQSYARVLRKLDAEDILVWNPYGTEILEVLSISDLRCLWQGMLATEYIFRWYCTLHPYETSPGSADRARSQALDLIRRGIRSGDAIPAIREAASAMASVPSTRSDPEVRSSRIKVGIIGDLYTRIHPFANQNLYQTLEDLGCEVLAPPFLTDGQLYDLWDHPHQYAIHGQYSRATRRALLSLYQLEEAWRVRRLFPPDPEITYDSLGWTRQRITADYFASDVDGYLAQNLGKGIDFIEIGAEGILNVMCHNCMVGLTSDAVFPEVRSDHHDVPFFSLAYDSLGDVHVGTRLEAFVDLLRNRRYNVR
jgi:predicted CoA-substrate-specific enzyme activase